MCFLTEPLKLFGGGSYALTSMKEIDGTDSFMTHAEHTHICQNRETKEKCLTQHFLKKGSEECKCTPFRLRNYTREVYNWKDFYNFCFVY